MPGWVNLAEGVTPEMGGDSQDHIILVNSQGKSHMCGEGFQFVCASWAFILFGAAATTAIPNHPICAHA